ncbi:tryptophan 7-halogenase [Rugosimonospora africana]|uniref:FAD-binding protein n=1 Tax=Rugosimonospora africana TaxID=556532 RepID=A0A8J3QLQ7_9ACTN|nr:tryptophan 7-halogenase [Rugosimonospora africana]GIH11902.1 FAD-binding protein [Rugosimonospora africana]
MEQYDVVVVGGGPGGSTVASFVAMRGHRVLLLEREEFPRYQIGESLLPATTQWICGLLGVTEELAAASFTRKSGGTFLWGTSSEPWSFNFTTASHGERYAYQVERMKFDQILLNNARRHGVEVRERCAVQEAYDDGDRVRGVRYVDADGQRHEVAARFVVDASGNQSRLYTAAGATRVNSDFFRNIALFGYFEGGARMPQPRSGNIVCAAFRDGWFWYIPLSDTLTSVGAVVPSSMADKVRGDREQALAGLIEECPLISGLLTNAHRVTEGTYGEIRVRKDYSYHTTRFWRPGIALVGDAACFVDPLFSTGVYLATYSALLAARSINTVLADRLDEATVFAESEFRHRREYQLYHEFLRMMYHAHVDEGSYFWTARKLTDSPVSDADAFSELTAGLGAGEFNLPELDGPARQRTAGTGSGGVGLATRPAVHTDEDEAMNRQWRGRTRARLQGPDQERLLASIETSWRDRPGRLVASADSLHWELPD